MELRSTGTGQISKRLQQNQDVNHRQGKNIVTGTHKMISAATA